MDCIVLAGNRENYRSVAREDNKAFLKVGGRSILHIILEELRAVDRVDRVLVVGPKDRLQEEVGTHLVAAYPKPLLFYQQGRNLVENILGTVAASATGVTDRVVMVIPSDIPLITCEELNQFIDRCDMDAYDYVGGITSAHVLARYAPQADQPGVTMATFRLNSGSYRVSNLHLVRPAAVKRADYIRQTYALRYQKQLANIAKMWLVLLGLLWRVPTAPFYFLVAQGARHCEVWGYQRLAKYLSGFVTLSRAEGYISSILGTRFKVVETDFGGAAVDVDNEADYHTISRRFDEWRRMQRRRLT
ncbi:NTP transferase domain-containing protein [Acanthopleuribacter pedis]|uniref:NTP transferase domain-containing protein n=1 Tax=Acanthopleuribacter pedis TaxID=442870 RepID=A0A8J7QBH0_9BACT|nr:NTP transferase domain-containing protein [Acanthopleuribacter pedis]MBO1320629.1 NTP transferase domain-containing protein [Acanthopleuribacter pedis]